MIGVHTWVRCHALMGPKRSAASLSFLHHSRTAELMFTSVSMADGGNACARRHICHTNPRTRARAHTHADRHTSIIHMILCRFLQTLERSLYNPDASRQIRSVARYTGMLQNGLFVSFRTKSAGPNTMRVQASEYEHTRKLYIHTYANRCIS